MKFALAGGGTGGHAYPSITVGEELRDRANAEVVYYGSEHGPERALATAAGFAYRAIPASQVRGGPGRMLLGGLNLLRGRLAAQRALAADRPAALFATGGYAAAPVGWAAPAVGVPLLVFLPDVRPGWAVRFLARYATRVACSVDASIAALPASRTVVTGYPVRRQFTEATRADGVARFGLQPLLPTLLVTGGSLGAHRLNVALAAGLPRLLEHAQVLHVSGRDEEPWLQAERERLPASLQERYHLHGYTEEMASAMAASDLAITRAGASTLGELPMSGLPAIVIPGDFSDQHANADYLASRGAAIVLRGDELHRLEGEALRLLADAPARAAMVTAMRALARPDAAAHLATIMQEIAA
ncbi:MAG: UDP-N-acetylglucosamine--N-acetylmuramyl-(pentapeptide) pyrophosphoryl-undecaprenol N-acetylglucosamine transferase [Chloroflexi bacterium]|nr:MAG: UDP-N-acetylglucosamine--N-acetylmuramyl-(pentapeptide) pyrophosphoryl-undecaprenol N-acetylglucosamine transferase [Chloroflexota bacterium]